MLTLQIPPAGLLLSHLRKSGGIGSVSCTFFRTVSSLLPLSSGSCRCVEPLFVSCTVRYTHLLQALVFLSAALSSHEIGAFSAMLSTC